MAGGKNALGAFSFKNLEIIIIITFRVSLFRRDVMLGSVQPDVGRKCCPI